ncbi:MAG: hypothetical protein E7288_08090 [Lachnospiraceae bacterium]|nr:hypothetical protein [Lachnospiraceae bacterium]
MLLLTATKHCRTALRKAPTYRTNTDFPFLIP